MDAVEYAKGFKGLETRSIDGTDFRLCYQTIAQVLHTIRKERRPFLVHARVPLLNHHTSGVRKEWYRNDLEEATKRDPFTRMRSQLIIAGFNGDKLNAVEQKAAETVAADYEKALKAEDPKPEDLFKHDFAPTPITEEKGVREPKGKDKTVMVDCALFAIQELNGKTSGVFVLRTRCRRTFRRCVS